MPQVKGKIRCMEQRHSYCMVVKTKVPGGIVPQFIILVQHVTICIIRGRNKSNYLKFLISNGRITIVPVLLIVIYMYIHGKLLQSCPTLCNPMDCSLLGSSVHEILQQEYWSGLPCPAPGDLPYPGIKPRSSAAPASEVDSLLLSDQGSPYTRI